MLRRNAIVALIQHHLDNAEFWIAVLDDMDGDADHEDEMREVDADHEEDVGI